MKQNVRNFWLDISLSVSFLATIITGVLIWLVIPHQAAAVVLGIDRGFWLSVHLYSALACFAGSILHIIWHRTWLKALRKRPMASLPRKIRANRMVDRFIWLTFLAASSFGVIDWISSDQTMGSLVNRLHVVFGMALLLGITVHLVFHRRWISSTTKQTLGVERKETASLQQ